MESSSNKPASLLTRSSSTQSNMNEIQKPLGNFKENIHQSTGTIKSENNSEGNSRSGSLLNFISAPDPVPQHNRVSMDASNAARAEDRRTSQSRSPLVRIAETGKHSVSGAKIHVDSPSRPVNIAPPPLEDQEFTIETTLRPSQAPNGTPTTARSSFVDRVGSVAGSTSNSAAGSPGSSITGSMTSAQSATTSTPTGRRVSSNTSGVGGVSTGGTRGVVVLGLEKIQFQTKISVPASGSGPVSNVISSNLSRQRSGTYLKEIIFEDEPEYRKPEPPTVQIASKTKPLTISSTTSGLGTSVSISTPMSISTKPMISSVVKETPMQDSASGFSSSNTATPANTEEKTENDIEKSPLIKRLNSNSSSTGHTSNIKIDTTMNNDTKELPDTPISSAHPDLEGTNELKVEPGHQAQSSESRAIDPATLLAPISRPRPLSDNADRYRSNRATIIDVRDSEVSMETANATTSTRGSFTPNDSPVVFSSNLSPSSNVDSGTTIAQSTSRPTSMIDTSHPRGTSTPKEKRNSIQPSIPSVGVAYRSNAADLPGLHTQGGLSASHSMSSINRHVIKSDGPYENLLVDVIFVISGIVNPERTQIRDLAAKMGAVYCHEWSSECTHLISPTHDTIKAKSVKEGLLGHIVRPEWIEDSFSYRRRLPESLYAASTTSEEAFSYIHDESTGAESFMLRMEKSEDGRSKTASNPDLPDILDSRRGTLIEASSTSTVTASTAANPPTIINRALVTIGSSSASGSSKLLTNSKDPSGKPSQSESGNQDDSNRSSGAQKQQKQVNSGYFKDGKPPAKRDETLQNADGQYEFVVTERVSALPEFFKSVMIVIDPAMAVSKRRMLMRHIIAYDGTIQSAVGPETTHVCTDRGIIDSHILKLLDGHSPGVVKPEWIFSCHHSGSKVSTVPYLLV